MIFPRGGTGRTGFLTAGWFLVDFPLFRLPSDHALKLLERTLRRAGAGRQERPGLLLCIFGCSSASITSCWARNHIHFSSQDKAAYNISVFFHPFPSVSYTQHLLSSTLLSLPMQTALQHSFYLPLLISRLPG